MIGLGSALRFGDFLLRPLQSSTGLGERPIEELVEGPSVHGATLLVRTLDDGGGVAVEAGPASLGLRAAF